MRAFLARLGAIVIAFAVSFTLLGAFRQTTSVQRGYPGNGMEVTEFTDRLADKAAANAAPPAFPPAAQDGQLAVDAYKNVQVLGHLPSGEFTRLMTAISTWVSPNDGGCAYCHVAQRDAAGNIVRDDEGNPLADQNKLDSDDLYTKRVARRMLQMTLHINSDWKSHVKETGVTCYTCHRGLPVPANLWWDTPENPAASTMLGDSAGQNHPSEVAGGSSLPSDVFRPFLDDDDGIRVISTEPLPLDNRHSIKQAEFTYGLMMHFSKALGVNCTHCHNTRSMGEWSVSPPARAQAWYAIRMARELNKGYLEPLATTFPPERLGPAGDSPKLNCATCHAGAYKPLLGAPMLKDYAVLAEARPQPAKRAPESLAPDGGTPDLNPAAPLPGTGPATPAANPKP